MALKGQRPAKPQILYPGKLLKKAALCPSHTMEYRWLKTSNNWEKEKHRGHKMDVEMQEYKVGPCLPLV
jgi:hypothetical protein